MSATLPPIGAKVRATRTLDGTTVTVEGVITSAYGRGYEDTDSPAPTIVLAGNEHVRLAEWAVHEGIWTAAVEVLAPPQPPEPPNRTVLHDGNATWERDDDAAEAGRRGDAHWFHAADGDRVSYRYAEMLAATKRRTLLVPDPAADAPTLPWKTDNHGDGGIEVRRDPSAGEALLVNGRALSANAQRELLSILARQLKPGAERDALFAAAEGRAR